MKRLGFSTAIAPTSFELLETGMDTARSDPLTGFEVPVSFRQVIKPTFIVTTFAVAESLFRNPHTQQRKEHKSSSELQNS